MNRKKKLLTSILCGIFVAILVVSGILAATHSQYDCPDENCPVCALISTWQQLRGMILIAVLGSFLLLVQHSPGISMSARFNRVMAHTLVTLKVKLSD